MRRCNDCGKHRVLYDHIFTETCEKCAQDMQVKLLIVRRAAWVLFTPPAIFAIVWAGNTFLDWWGSLLHSQ